MSIEQWSDLMFPDKEGKDTHLWGSVKSVNPDGSYEVQLNSSSVTTRCAAGCTAGVGDRVLVCIMANGRCVAVSRLEGEDTYFKKETVFEKIVNFFGNLYLDNLKYLHTRNADGAARNALGMNSSNQLLLGYGGYSNSEGSTNIYGNKIFMMDKGAGNAICSLNGGFALPEGADLNDYVTVGNYYSNNSTLSESLKNTPYTGGSLSLKVICPYGTNLSGVDVIVQEMTVSNGRQYWRRTGDRGATWTNWYLNLSDKDVLDYPYAQGTSSSWRYRKWNSGWAECWRTIEVSCAATNSYGDLYYANKGTYSFPFTFTEEPNVIGTPWMGNGLWNVSVHSVTTAGFKFYAQSAASVTDTPSFNFYAAGWWK